MRRSEAHNRGTTAIYASPGSLLHKSSERERKREREREREGVCVCEREREKADVSDHLMLKAVVRLTTEFR